MTTKRTAASVHSLKTKTTRRNQPHVKENGGNHAAGNQSRSRAFAAAYFLRTPQVRSLGFRSGGDGDSFRHASGGSGCPESIAPVWSSRSGTTATLLFLRPYGEVFGVACQIRVDRCRRSPMSAPVLSV